MDVGSHVYYVLRWSCLGSEEVGCTLVSLCLVSEAVVGMQCHMFAAKKKRGKE